MNQTSQYIFNLYHYLLNLRDTMEFVIDREHKVELYNQRKNVLTKGLEPTSALGSFLENNKEQSEKLVEKIKEFLADFYSDESTVITVSGDKLRIDHTQNIKILEATVQLSESIRDIVYGYVNYAKGKNELEPVIADLIAKDEKLHRHIVSMLVMGEFQKSFGEFQKVMGESQGKPTPQSNFIVQNELAKLAQLVRFSRSHAHCTDNETLDLLDKALQVLEMTEGRRDRRNNRSFKDLFDEINKDVSDAIRLREPEWKAVYDKALAEALTKPNTNPNA